MSPTVLLSYAPCRLYHQQARQDVHIAAIATQLLWCNQLIFNRLKVHFPEGNSHPDLEGRGKAHGWGDDRL